MNEIVAKHEYRLSYFENKCAHIPSCYREQVEREKAKVYTLRTADEVRRLFFEYCRSSAITVRIMPLFKNGPTLDLFFR